MREQIYSKIQSDGKKIAILIDPDKASFFYVEKIIDLYHLRLFDFILVGGSLVSSNNIVEIITKIKSECDVPVILFPGNLNQICASADAILFLTLLSGRNPEYLIGQQVQAAPLLIETSLEVLSTAYLLIESGSFTSVQYMTQTLPIPRAKSDIAVATALAGELLGCKNIYLEAGSGANQTVPIEMIEAVKKKIKIPLWVGGGIRTPEAAEGICNAGADVIVLGSIFESDAEIGLQICKTIKSK